MPKPKFRGRIALDARDSTPDWSAFEPPSARDGAPNILYLVLDDVGFGALDCYGGLIEAPNISRIASRGLRYTQFHTTALCSPSRSCFLNGRNATSNGMACISEFATGFPCANGRIPFENAMISQVLVDNGYSAYALGKWHLTPDYDNHASGSRTQWPLGRGFERFYGFLGGETNQWYPQLIQDNQSIDQPYLPEQGYHFSKDLIDKALQYVQDGRASDPDKPWLMYLAPGAAHAPHHVPKEWADKYRGKFDMGYEKYREQTLARQIKMGLVPAGTQLTPLNPYANEKGPKGQPWPEQDTIPPWDSLSDDAKKLFCRMAEVYAGFVSHFDDQLGRLLSYLEESGQLDNTLIVVVSDNGASGEGGPNGTVNEMKFFNGVVDTIEDGLKQLDELGSPKTYNHYNNGWAQAFCTPFKLYKRYASFEGGTADPLILSWPKSLKAHGELRDQYCHAIDLVPTLYECLGIEAPEVVHGYTQSEIEGVSLAYSFDDAKAKTRKFAQFYSMLGTRGVWSEGWHAATVHPATSGWSGFEQDRWELYNLDEDRSEAKNLADKHPEKLEHLRGLWAVLAGKYQGFPLDDRSPVEIMTDLRPRPGKPRSTYVYYPHCEPVPQGVGVSTIQRSFDIAADVTVQDQHPDGVIFAQGSDTGGHTLYVKDGRLQYVYNWLGDVQQKLSAADPLAPGKHRVGVRFELKSRDKTKSPVGPATLFIDGKAVASENIRTAPGTFGLEGVVTVGRDTGRPASDDYASPSEFTGGEVEKVTVTVQGSPHKDPSQEAQMAQRRD